MRNLVGYSSWGCKESNMTEVTLHARTQGTIRMPCPSLYRPMTNVKSIPPHQNLTESYFLSRVRWPEEKVSSYPGPSLLNLKLAFRKWEWIHCARIPGMTERERNLSIK